jgi:hypothetical protein
MLQEERDYLNEVLTACTSLEMPVTSVGWSGRGIYRRLIIATPWVDQNGKKATLRAFYNALEKAGLKDIRTWIVHVLSPDDPAAKNLQD